MRYRRAVAVAATAAAVASVSAPALANGRFPAAGQVVVDPGDPLHIVLRTTYGILQTTDAGVTWRWICEQSVGYGGIEDPAMGVTGDGTVLAGIFEGLSASHDHGCSWAFAGGLLDQQYTIDVAVETTDPARAVAVTSTGITQGFHVVLAETTDNGKTWTKAGVDMPVDFLALTVEIAPSLTDRVYVSGLSGMNYVGALQKSEDRGKTWKQIAFDLKGALAPYIGAVDPSNPDRVYVRVDTATDDELYVSDDGASTWTKILTAKGEMLGFALSPDGSKVAAGGPDSGLFVASTSDFVFKQVSQVGVKCLEWQAAEQLYACADEFKDGFTLGVSKNDGGSFTPVYHLPDLAPLECDASTPTGAACPAAWPGVASTIGADSGSSSSTSGAQTAAATSGAPATPPKDESSTCTVPSGGSSDRELGAPIAAMILGLGAAALRRSRRRRTL